MTPSIAEIQVIRPPKAIPQTGRKNYIKARRDEGVAPRSNCR